MLKMIKRLTKIFSKNEQKKPDQRSARFGVLKNPIKEASYAGNAEVWSAFIDTVVKKR